MFYTQLFFLCNLHSTLFFLWPLAIGFWTLVYHSSHRLPFINFGGGMEHAELERIFIEHGFENFTWIYASDIEVAQWVRMKCTYGCGSYGKKATCPPNAPSFEECRRFFQDYGTGVLFHFRKKLEDPEKRDIYTRKINSGLLKVERDVFLSDYRKAFLFFMDECQLCEHCPGTLLECRNPRMARPSPESFCVDVFATVKKLGYPIEVLKDYDREMNRYAFLMVE